MGWERDALGMCCHTLSFPPGTIPLHRKIKFINVNVWFVKVRSAFAVPRVGGKQIHLRSGHGGTAVTLKRGAAEPLPRWICGWDQVWSPSLLLWALGGGSKVTGGLEKWIFWCNGDAGLYQNGQKKEESLKKTRQDEISRIYPQWAVAVKEEIPVKAGLRVIRGRGTWCCHLSWVWQQLLHLFQGNDKKMELIRLEKTFKSTQHHHHIHH